jgi:hypothetical protein
VAALLVASALIVAPSASAANLDPADEINGGDYTLTLTPASGTGAGALQAGPTEVTTSTGCPEGYRIQSRTFLVAPDGTETKAAIERTNASAAAWGLQGNPMTLTGIRASTWGAFTDQHLPTGLHRFVVTCDAPTATGGRPPVAGPIGDARYFVGYIEVDRAAQSWRVVDAPPAEKADTTTTLTPTARNDGSVRLQADVAPSTAAGTVTFTDVATGATVGSGTLAEGVASVAVTGLEPGATYTFRAQYAGDSAHNASTSDDETVTTVTDAVPPQRTDVEVTIPCSTGGLLMTVSPDGVTLGEAALDGSDFVASGRLEQVRVSDRRPERTRWTLNGQASDLVREGDAGTTIPASRLGWAPEAVGGDNAGTPGAAVAPGTDDGLSEPKALATAPTGVGGTETTVRAEVSLRTPQDTPGGAYASTLTLTLI